MQKGTNKWVITATVMVPTAMEILDTSVANVALAHIQGSLSAGLDEVTWVLTSYLVANAVVLPMTGWLSATFGRKRFLVACVAAFTVFSLLCGFAPSLGYLITFRLLQGMSGGALQPMSQAILLETFPKEEHGMAMAVYALGVVVAPIFGPVLGGYIVDQVSWRWIFYINVPVGALSVLAMLAFISDPPYLQRARRRVDVIGMGLLIVGVGALQVMLDKGNQDNWFSSRFIIAMAMLAFTGLSALIGWELVGTDEPLIDLRVFRIRSFGIGSMVMFFIYGSFFGSIVLLPIYLQNLMGYTALWAGILLGPGGLVTILTLPLVGALVRKGFARSVLAFGLLVSALSIYLMAHFNLQADFRSILIPRVVLGLGISCFFVPLTTLTVSDIRPQQMGNATGLFSFVRNVGGAIGVSLITNLLARRSQFHQARIADTLDFWNPGVRQTLGGLSRMLVHSGAAPAPRSEAQALVYRTVLRESSMLAFNDAFYILFLCMLGTVPLVLLFRRSKKGVVMTGE